MSRTVKTKSLIEKIQGHVVEQDGCWIWTGAVQIACGCVPTMNHNGKVGAVRRFILEEQGVVLGKRVATYTCGNPKCVHPDHTAPATRRAVQLRSAKESGYASNPARRKKLAENARKRAKLSMELAAEIRNAEGTQRQIAQRYGVSQSVVGRVIRGQAWLSYSSPFAGLGAL